MERAGRGAHDVSSVCKMEGEDGHGRFHDLDTGELRSFLALPKKWDTLALAAEESRDFKLSPRAHGEDVIPTLQNMGQGYWEPFVESPLFGNDKGQSKSKFGQRPMTGL